MTSRTVVTFGTFDLFHIGHLEILRRARQLGDRLVVGISTDELNYKKKGKYPVFPQTERRQIVAAIRDVDDTFFEESLEQKRQYLVTHRADVLVMGADWAGRFDEFRDICQVAYLPRTEAVSTSTLEQFIAAEWPDRIRPYRKT